MALSVGDRSRCRVCGGKIVLISHPRIIALDAGVWIHESWLRRSASNHAAAGPLS